MSTTKLAYSQQLLLQRMLSEHILTDEEAKALFADITQTCNNAQDSQSQSQLNTNTDQSLEACIGTINSAIVPLLQIEICTIIMPKGGVNVRYHGVVNKMADDAAKLYAAPGRTVHEVALFRLLLERIVASENDVQEDEVDSSNGVGCSGYVAVNDAVGLRLELKGAHRNKLTATQADAAIGGFLREKWLARKQSGRNIFVAVGPRTYMELPDLLTDLGVERLPQIIVNRR